MQPVEELILKMADDALIMGHRNSEWTGLGPILEEDIALSSMAQDKIGHAHALYTILHEQFDQQESDILAFHRVEKDFKSCHLVEFPIGEYDFTLARHFLFDHAEFLRYELLMQSSFEPLARLAKKIHGELKYHVLHANSWLIRLGNGTDESHARMQAALQETYSLAHGIFEESPFEKELMEQKIFAGESALKKLWEGKIGSLIEQSNLKIPEVKDSSIGMGGRNGYHTEHLQPLLNEMSEVFRMEENIEW